MVGLFDTLPHPKGIETTGLEPCWGEYLGLHNLITFVFTWVLGEQAQTRGSHMQWAGQTQQACKWDHEGQEVE